MIGLVAGSPQSDNGKKLINFLLDKPAQMQVSALSWGLPVRQDITPTDSHYQKAHQVMAGVTPWSPDWNAVATSLSADIARWRQVTEGE